MSQQCFCMSGCTLGLSHTGTRQCLDSCTLKQCYIRDFLCFTGCSETPICSFFMYKWNWTPDWGHSTLDLGSMNLNIDEGNFTLRNMKWEVAHPVHYCPSHMWCPLKFPTNNTTTIERNMAYTSFLQVYFMYLRFLQQWIISDMTS
jgi:hypothetical protein